MSIGTGRWFGGDRELAEQLLGLEPLLARAAGCTLFDLGCAEGLIAAAFLGRGAALAHGCDVLIDRVEAARAAAPAGRFWTMDLNYFREFYEVNRQVFRRRYDIVLALSVAHKLREPEAFLDHCMNLAERWLAVRLPAEIICDKRSGERAIDAHQWILHRGFRLLEAPPTCRGEWLGIFARVV